MWTIAAILSAAVALGNAHVIKDGGLIKGVDTLDLVTDEVLECYKSHGVEVIAVRVYDKGDHDATGILNLKNIHNNITTIAYVTPSVDRYASLQLKDIVDFARLNGFIYTNLFLQLVHPEEWYKPHAHFPAPFIDSFIAVARSYGIKIVFYTNWYDYELLDKNTLWSNAIDPWYWTLGGGRATQTEPNFDDFRPFGGFKKPFAKHYKTLGTECAIVYNEHVFNGLPEPSVAFFSED